jgi:tyrosinase
MSNNVVYEWTTRIHAKKHELGGSFSVLVFLGEVPKDPEEWTTSPSYVGSHSVYTSGMDRPQGDQANTVTEGFVHLNMAIAERSGLSSYEPGGVIPYLKDNLNWSIQAVRAFFICLAVDPAGPDTLSTSF